MSTATQAVRAADFIGSIGVNTHIDFTWTSYGNLQVVENAINYLGVKNLRDSANNPNDVGAHGWWQQVADATGAKFDAFIGQGSPQVMQTGLTYIPQLASQHILSYLEGGNEEDGAYAVANGNSLATTAQFQQQVYSTGHQLGLQVINMSFGAGWDTSPTGDYGKVGDLSAYADFGNAHTYFGTGNPPDYNINFVNSLADMAAHNRPVITTEMGWYTTGSTADANSVSETVQAKYMLDGLLDAYKDGDVKTYLYELLDQKKDTYSEDNFGLFHADGTAKLAAVALHNLTTLLADTGNSSGSFTPGALSYSLSGLQSTDHSLLLEKSDGSYWLALWDETRLSSATQGSTDIAVGNHTVTLNLDSAVSSIAIYDPLTGTTAVQSVNNASSVQISLPDHPVLVQVVPSGAAPVPVDPTPTPPAPPPAPTYDSHDLSLAVPSSASTLVNGTVAVAASVSDDWAQNQGSNLILNLSVGRGTLLMNDGNGNAVSGSGTSTIHLTGTVDQINADLTSLQYHAGNFDGNDQFVFDVWNQAGVEVTKSVNVNIASPYSSNDLAIVNPAAIKLAVKDSVQVTGVHVNDDWAQHHDGLMALNLYVSKGSIAMTDVNGNAINGSGTNTISLNGTFDQINAALSTLSYRAPTSAATANLRVDMWNQAGVEVTHNITVNALSSASSISGTSGNDILSGVLGGTLKGGFGSDTFTYTMLNMGVGSKANHIADFHQSEGDKIDLHGYGLTADDFVGTGPLTGAHSISYDASNKHSYTLIKIDTDGDHISDHEIKLDNLHVALHNSDFMFV